MPDDDPVVEDAVPTLPTLEQWHRRTAEVAMMPDDLKAKAEALAVELGDDLDALVQFWAELHQGEHMLTAEDRCAAHYAVTLALASYPLCHAR